MRLVSGSPDKKYILESMGGGVAFLDYDNDGWLDIYLVNGSTMEAERDQNNREGNRLYRNNRDLTFTDVTETAGVGDTHWGMGACAGDLNNDGFEDLYVTNYGSDVLYLNDRGHAFRKENFLGGEEEPSWHSGCAFVDYDRDGDLDLYVAGYVQFDAQNPLEPVGPSGERIPQLGPAAYRPLRDRFYRNDGAGRFRDVTRESGLGEPEPFNGLGVVWGDYDNDGDPDVFVANDATPNYLFQNMGQGSFLEVALPMMVALGGNGLPQAGMGVDFADYDNDGDLDLHVTNFAGEWNALYRNDGEPGFVDATVAVGTWEAGLRYMGWGTRFVDLDLDGWLDLVVVNGHLYPEADQDVQAQTHNSGLKQPNLFFRNRRDGTFERLVPEASGLGELQTSRGLAAGDINNDGQVDLLISNLDAPPSLLLNQGVSGHWMLVKLSGRRSNRSAIGSRVTVRTGDRIQMREVQGGGSYLSQHDLRLHFGLGEWDRVEELKIRWPDGTLETHRDLKADQILVFEEKE